MPIELPSQDLLNKLLRYDPETGKLFWLPRPIEMFATERAGNVWNARFPNTEAFTALIAAGYRGGLIWGTLYRAHRVIWKMQYNSEPTHIDHINGIMTDNRLANLRAVSPSENSKNAKLGKRNTSGTVGVYLCKDRKKKWAAKAMSDGKFRNVGYFYTREEALAARKAAEAKYGFHPNHGKSR